MSICISLITIYYIFCFFFLFFPSANHHIKVKLNFDLSYHSLRMFTRLHPHLSFQLFLPHPLMYLLLSFSFFPYHQCTTLQTFQHFLLPSYQFKLQSFSLFVSASPIFGQHQPLKAFIFFFLGSRSGS